MKKINLFFLVFISLLSCSRSMREGMHYASDEREEAVEEVFFMLAESDEEMPVALQESLSKGITNKTWKRSGKKVNTVSLFVGDKEQLPLRAQQIAVQIDGFRARVLIDCFFYSNEEQLYEGTFKMKLPQGASPYYMAFGETVFLNKPGKDSIHFVPPSQLDFSVDGIEDLRAETFNDVKLARVVEKKKAAFAYESTVRRSIDPALAEWGGADIFNCRVFPISANKLHRIVFGYDVNLSKLNNDYIFNLSVPDSDCPTVVDVKMAEIQGLVASTESDYEFKHQQSGYKTLHLENPDFENLLLRYQGVSNIGLNYHNEQESYFATSLNVPVSDNKSLITSDRAIFMLDVSLSSNPDKFNIWLKLIEAVLNNNRESLHYFNVLMFNVGSHWYKNKLIANSPENVAAFMNFANKLILEGATDIGMALNEVVMADWARNSKDNVFLLSDGSDTWGELNKYALVEKVEQGDVVYAFNTGISGTSLPKLEFLTQSTGGAVFSLMGEDEIIPASKAFNTKPWKIENIAIDGIQDLLIKGQPNYIYPNQPIILAGRGKGSHAVVRMKLTQGTLKKLVEVPIEHIIDSELTKRLYGQIGTEILESYGTNIDAKAVAYAQHFVVPGKTCSLLMLESDDEYEQYNISRDEDLYVVKSTTVLDIVKSVIDKVHLLLGDKKAKFLDFLKILSNTPGAEFDISASLELLVQNTPKEHFNIKQETIISKVYTKDKVSKEYINLLQQAELDYDSTVAEAEVRMQTAGTADALIVISSLIENNPGNPVILRDVAYSAIHWSYYGQACFLLERVLQNRPYEPQSYLSMAKSLSESGNHALAMLYYEISITAKWDTRFGDFRKIALLDYINLLSRLKSNSNFVHQDYAISRINTLKSELDISEADIMVTISWNTDNSDVDLHVIEPTGEKCYYENPKTKIGGALTKDVTQGYGPEMYVLQKAKKGKYTVKVKYFSSNRNRASTRTKVYARIYRNWGTPEEEVLTKVITLEDNKEMHEIMELSIK